jgi:hypothetical protein
MYTHFLRKAYIELLSLFPRLYKNISYLNETFAIYSHEYVELNISRFILLLAVSCTNYSEDLIIPSVNSFI